MSERLIVLEESIHNNQNLESSFFTDDLINEIINLDDSSEFHLILNYIEKVEGVSSFEIMDRRKKKNNQLVGSFDKESGLFARDEEFIENLKTIGKLNEQFNRNSISFLDNYSSSLTNYEDIVNIINSKLFLRFYFDINCSEIMLRMNEKMFEKVKVESILDELDTSELLKDNEREIVVNLFNEMKDFYRERRSIMLQLSELETKVYGFINENFSYDVRPSINKKIEDGDIDSVRNYLKNNNTKILRDTLISTFFEDAPDNFIKNLLNVVRFQQDSGIDIVDAKTLKIYQTIISSLKNDNPEELFDLYQEMLISGINYKEVFYDDYVETRKTVSSMIMDSVYKIDDTRRNYHEVDGVRCYDLTGEPFYMMVHASREIISDFSNGTRDRLSMSLISGDRLNVFSDIIYGFDDLRPDQFMEVYTADAASTYDEGNEQISGINLVPTYTTPKKIIEETPVSEFNEILYYTGSSRKKYDGVEVPKPSYIVCLDEPNLNSIKAAHNLNVPIVIVHTEYYPKIQKNSLGPLSFLNNMGETYKSF